MATAGEVSSRRLRPPWAAIGTGVVQVSYVRGAEMNDESGSDGVVLFACGLLRDHSGRVLIVQMGADTHNGPSWWLPGAQVLPAAGAVEALRTFLTHDLRLQRPEIRGQQVTSCDPSPSEPGGQFMLLFDHGPRRTTRPPTPERPRVRSGCLLGHVRTGPGSPRAHRIPRAGLRSPASAAGPLPTSASYSDGPQPPTSAPGIASSYGGETEESPRQPASPDMVMPGIDLDLGPDLPRR